MWCKFIFICTVFTFVITEKCERQVFKYEIARFTPKYETTKDDFEQDVIKNDMEAYYINMTGPIKTICKGSLDISVKSAHFWCDVPSLEYIEVGAFDDQIIYEQFRITRGNLNILRTGTFKNMSIREMTLNNNNIEKIEESAIANMPNLTTLYLSNNKISSLHPDAVINTPKLMWFDISKNKLKILSDNIFKFLSKKGIVGIGVSDNEIEEMVPTAFQGLNVYTLGLDNNSIKSLPDTLFTENKEMGEIHLVNNQLTSLNDAFFDVKTWSNVFLKGNDFDCPTILKLDKLSKTKDFVNKSDRKKRSLRYKRLSFYHPPRLSYDTKVC